MSIDSSRAPISPSFSDGAIPQNLTVSYDQIQPWLDLLNSEVLDKVLKDRGEGSPMERRFGSETSVADLKGSIDALRDAFHEIHSRGICGDLSLEGPAVKTFLALQALLDDYIVENDRDLLQEATQEAEAVRPAERETSLRAPLGETALKNGTKLGALRDRAPERPTQRSSYQAQARSADIAKARGFAAGASGASAALAALHAGDPSRLGVSVKDLGRGLKAEIVDPNAFGVPSYKGGSHAARVAVINTALNEALQEAGSRGGPVLSDQVLKDRLQPALDRVNVPYIPIISIPAQSGQVNAGELHIKNKILSDFREAGLPPPQTPLQTRKIWIANGTQERVLVFATWATHPPQIFFEAIDWDKLVNIARAISENHTHGWGREVSHGERESAAILLRDADKLQNGRVDHTWLTQESSGHTYLEHALTVANAYDQIDSSFEKVKGSLAALRAIEALEQSPKRAADPMEAAASVYQRAQVEVEREHVGTEQFERDRTARLTRALVAFRSGSASQYPTARWEALAKTLVETGEFSSVDAVLIAARDGATSLRSLFELTGQGALFDTSTRADRDMLREYLSRRSGAERVAERKTPKGRR